MNPPNPHRTKRGFSLIQCLLFILVILIMGSVTFRLVNENKRLSLASHWGRSAEALADGALAMALEHLNSGEGEGELSTKLSTGTASARISVSQDHPEERLVVYEGVAGTLTKVRATRKYEATLGSTNGKSWSVWSVRRL